VCPVDLVVVVRIHLILGPELQVVVEFPVKVIQEVVERQCRRGQQFTREQVVAAVLERLVLMQLLLNLQVLELLEETV
jgi:hypothetical protein